MEIDIRVTDGVLVATPTGEMDANNCGQLADAVSGSLTDDVKRIEVQAGGLRFIDSSGISTIVELHERMGERGGSLAVVDPTTPVRRVLEITGLAAAFEL